MSSVRASKYRHVYGQAFKKDKTFDNIRLTKNAFDSNLAKANGKYVSLNWNASGGGAFAVLPLEDLGKLPDRFPLFTGHKGAVLDTEWNPFDENELVSASDDGTIGVWRIPKDFTTAVGDTPLDDISDVGPVKFLEGHDKRVGHVHYNPVARDILASSSLDHTIKVWNVAEGKVLYSLPHGDAIMSFTWNYDGTKIASVSKDKKIRVWDVRAEKVLSEGTSHAGSRAARIVWLGDRDRVLTTGFSRLSDRQLAIWNTKDLESGPIKGFRNIDQSSGIIMPFFDVGTSILYLGGRGDGTILYYEYIDDVLYDLFAYQSTQPQRGLTFAPANTLDIHGHEVARCYKVHETYVEPIPFYVPRKSEGFLSDVYGEVTAPQPALEAAEYASGKTSNPLVVSWRDIYDGKVPSTAAAKPAETKAETKTETKTETKAEAKTEAKEEPKKEEVKPKAAEKTQEPATNSLHALEKASKQDASEVFKTQDVQNFLSRAGEIDSEKPEQVNKEASSWDDEEDEALYESQKREPVKEAKPEEPKETKTEEPKETKPEEPKEVKVEEPKAVEAEKPKEAKVEEPKKVEAEPKLEEPKTLQTPEPESQSNGATASPVKAGIQKIAALADQVTKLTALVEKLSARVEELENKA